MPANTLQERLPEEQLKEQLNEAPLPVDVMDDSLSDKNISTPESLRGKYIFKSKLGKGTQGNTWLAEDCRTHKLVAIKSLNISEAENIDQMDEMIRLIRRESDVLKNLKCDNVPHYIQSFDFLDRKPPEYFLVQEYIQAPSLEALLREKKVFTESEVIDIANKLLDILETIHHATPPVIHRDIKPSNILMDDKGRVYLIDFGIAAIQKLGQSGMTMVGTCGYTAPEQFAGLAGIESDYYSLAATMVHLLSGKSPDHFERLTGEPLREALISTSENTASVIERMLSPDVPHRLACAPTIREQLTSGIPVSTLPARKKRSVGKSVAISTIFCLAIAAIFGHFAFQYQIDGHSDAMTTCFCLMAVSGGVWLALLAHYLFGNSTKKLLEKAEQGYTFEQYELAECYEFGDGVPRDMSKAFEWYLKAAQKLQQRGTIPRRIKTRKKHYLAKLRVAQCYENGDGTAVNKAMAATWYQKAAERGILEAQYAMGRMYETGTGISKNIAEAKKWYQLAAWRKHPNAQYHLGMIYKNFYEDNKNAEKWLRRAAGNGHTNAQNLLNEMFR